MSQQIKGKVKNLKPGEQPVYKSPEGICFTHANMEPTWIQLPFELGGKKVAVIEKFKAKVCPCGEHPTTVTILEGNYMLVECSTKGWTWFPKPPNLEQFKQILTM